jgi:hypothetical protein
LNKEFSFSPYFYVSHKGVSCKQFTVPAVNYEVRISSRKKTLNC